MGVLLRTTRDRDAWEEIYESKIWDLPEDQCDYEFEEEEVILLWRAEGFLQQKAKSQIRDFGNQCFRDLVPSRFDRAKKFEAFGPVNSVRTFLPIKLSNIWGSYLTSFVLNDLLPSLNYLRVLSLKGYYITELPDFFENLKHLHYLNFPETSIKYLPDSLCTLYHLETLKLSWCRELKELPSDIGEGDGHLIRELRNLSKLRGAFDLSGLENAKSQDARDAKLKEKSGIDFLTLHWSQFDIDTRNKEDEEQVLHFLCPQKKLEHLSILNYGVEKFSSWIAFTNLLSLNLVGCRNCKSLPSIGMLPLLKDLCICGMNEVNKIGVEFFGENQPNAFASLETLSFQNMPNWKEWDPCEGDDQVFVFPKLLLLQIESCPQLLGRLPTNHPSLQTLEVRWCTRLVSLSHISKFNILPERFRNAEYFEIDGGEELASLWQYELGLLGHRFITIQNCPQFVSLEREEVEERQFQLQKISHAKLPMTLKQIEIEGCPELECIAEDFHRTSALQFIELRECGKINSLPRGLDKLSHLQDLQISACPNLISFEESGLATATSLRVFSIYECENFGALPKCMYNFTSLWKLCLFKCSASTSFPVEDSPTGKRLFWSSTFGKCVILAIDKLILLL
ncbi:hypothetical protein PTKIN_Ptkin14bG0113400 [Pterospermum kingtungense]